MTIRKVREQNGGASTEVHDEDNKIKNNLPIDRGWAWVIVGATFCINLIQVGMYRSFGILFVEFLKEFKASTSVTSLIMGIYSASYSLTALFGLSIVLDRFSIRSTCILGGILMSLGGILSFFAMNIEFLIFTQSILSGMGSALLYGPGLVIIGLYFEKRRALAQAISSCGVSLGGMIVPQLIRYLLTEYGLRGTLLISGGLLMEILIFVLLYRPAPCRQRLEPEETNGLDVLEKFKEQIKSKSDFEIVSIEPINDNISLPPTPVTLSRIGHIGNGIRNGHTETDAVNGRPKQNISVAKMLMQKHEPFRIRTESDPTIQLHKRGVLRSFRVQNEPLLPDGSADGVQSSQSETNISDESSSLGENEDPLSPIRLHQTHKGHDSYFGSFIDTLSQSSYLKYASIADINIVSTLSLNNIITHSENVEEFEGNVSCCTKVRRSLDFSVLKRATFYVIAFFNFFGVCAVSLFAAYLPAAVEEAGFTNVESALLITIYAGVDCLSRFLSGVIVESGKIRAHHLLAIFMTATGVLYQLTKYYTSFNLLIMYSVLFGMFSGGFPAMNPVVMVELLGLETFPKALGFVQVFTGVSLAAIHPVLGALRDITGTYHASSHLLGACAIISSVFLLLEPLARKWDCSRNTKTKEGELKALNSSGNKVM
ncbi:monocarboxylate transporter 5-like isoform X1 [Haliotis cracherodii]|uniref:monocarboxylate transporter 5-like isoform X1 n=2 Tax=Haliotis cracherodii TaxID=6455 RepID=UPI0039EB3DFD